MKGSLLPAAGFGLLSRLTLSFCMALLYCARAAMLSLLKAAAVFLAAADPVS